ncbi:MAG: molybdopterin molybdotransferase MoeA [Actinomycetospora chiangmaiensis]|nr:molybdopterin molybdotransferase MoeA [Actinomycetospora chiangmaiensis]
MGHLAPPLAPSDPGTDMPEIAEALARIAALLHPLATERIALDEAWGRICAETLTARLTAPPFAVAAMDGYALRWEDRRQVLRRVGVAQAGDPMGAPLAPGTCLRIFTGAPVPPLADTVVQQERVATDGTCVRIGPDAEPFRHIRPAGSNLEGNAAIIQPGTRMSARDIGLAAAAGHARILVHRRPRVAVLSTGNELTDAFVEGRSGQILDANRPALKALVRAWGGMPLDLGIVPDESARISGRLAGLVEAERPDLLVTSGGASVGDFDLVGPALDALGYRPAFSKVRMRPGKATMFGQLGILPTLSLPGNSVSALVSALLFLRPALAMLGGAGPVDPPIERALLATPLPATGPRTTFLRGHLGVGPTGGLTFAVLPDQDTAMLSGLAGADALAVRPADAPPAGTGEPVAVLRFDLASGF